MSPLLLTAEVDGKKLQKKKKHRFQLGFGELGQCLGPHLQGSGSGRMLTPEKLVLRWPEVKKERCWLRNQQQPGRFCGTWSLPQAS